MALSQTQSIGGFDIPPVISNTVGNVTEKVKSVSDHIPDPVKETAKDIGKDWAQSKAADKLDSADRIVNNPLTKAVARMISPDAKHSVDDAGDKIKEKQKDKDIVGNHTKSLISKLEDSLDFYNT